MLKTKIICVGAGGTGGHFLASLGELLAHLQTNVVQWDLTIADGDIVEAHNLENQCFVEEDVGRNKAAVCADALQDAFGLSMDKISTIGYVDSENDLMNLVGESRNDLVILCGCVDNHKARQVMHRFFYRMPNIIYMDSGNDFASGQMVVGFRYHGQDFRPPRGYYFPDVMTDRTPVDRELSCGLVNVHSPQHIATNKKAANVMFSFIAWTLQEGVAILNASTALVSYTAFAEQCGLTTFKVFPPKEAREQFFPFLERCPGREEVVVDDYEAL